MIWLLFGLGGLGVWLIYDSLLPARPRPPRPPSRALSRLREWLVQTGVLITPRVFVLISLAGALLGGLAAQLLLGGPVFAVVGVLMGGATYSLVLRGRRQRRRQAVLQALPEAIDRLRDGLSSTIPM